MEEINVGINDFWWLQLIVQFSEVDNFMFYVGDRYLGNILRSLYLKLFVFNEIIEYKNVKK